MDKRQSVDLEEKRPTRSSDLQNKRLTGSIATIALTAASLGVIYGDLGTSPLYVFNAIFPSDGPTPNKEDVIGALSAIIWALTIVPLVKYAVIALEFGGKDNETGEGGPFAVYTALYPPAEETDDNRVLTSYTTMTRPRVDSFFEKTWVKQALFSWVLFGTCLTFSDGLLTPAVSVVSAVEGIAVASPPVANSVVPISIAILVCLFLLQALGTRRVGFLFAPIIGVWLITIAVSGAINVASHPSVFRAFDPSRAVLLFVRTKNYDLLSGVLLCITGCEAMFANLGQFSKTSIRLGFVGLVYPCCVLAYLGQGARLIEDGDNVIGNVFFQSIPGGVGGGFWYFTFVFAILAAIIASQAMISATFSLIHQLTRLKVMPAVRIVHSSDDVEGQVFVPAINILLMIGTVALTAGFGAGAGLTNAYGFAVAGVLIVTTTILTIAIVKLKRLPVIVAVIFFVFFIFVDGAFWGASLKKVPEGAWVPLGLAIILCIFLQFYAWAQGLEDKFDATHRTRLHNVIARGFISESDDEESTPVTAMSENGNEIEKVMESNDLSPAVATGSVGLQLPTLRKRPASTKLANYNDDLTLVKNNATLTRLPVFALFHNHSANTMNGAPHSFSAFLKCYPSLPQVCIFFNLRVVGIPHTNDEQRFIVSRVRSFDGIYIATIRLGYRDPINLADIARPIRDRIVAIESCGGEDAEEIRERIRMIDNAMELSVTHILPHFHVTVDQTQGSKFTRYIKTFLIESIYRRLKLNFDDYDAFEFGSSEESVLRMGVSAKL